jgi:hypothetical protein
MDIFVILSAEVTSSAFTAQLVKSPDIQDEVQS